MRILAFLAVALLVISLSACAQTNYKVVGYTDGEAGVQAYAGTPGAEKPITQPYVINGKATIIGQYPEQPHLEVILEPGATVNVQNPTPAYRYGAAGYCQPVMSGRQMGVIPGPVILDSGNTVIRRR